MWQIWILFLWCLLFNIIIVNHFSYHFIIFILLISFFCVLFLICSRCICFYWIYWLYLFIIVSTQWSLVNFFSKNIMFLLLNLCFDFNINLLVFINSIWFPLGLSISNLFFSSWFILFSIWVASKRDIYNLQI